jgi:hypothetical protein
MKTDDLIRSLAADTRPGTLQLTTTWWIAALAAVALAALVFALGFGPRPDFAVALETPRFLFKFVFTIAVAAGAFAAARNLARPGERLRSALPYLVAAPVLIIAAIVAELVSMPPETWATRLIGSNSLVCLTSIPILGIGPLGIFLLALRGGAPTRPAFAGAVAGLLAGGIAAAVYAAECTDESPLFVATGYTIAIAGLAALGALGATRFVRW